MAGTQIGGFEVVDVPEEDIHDFEKIRPYMAPELVFNEETKETLSQIDYLPIEGDENAFDKRPLSTPQPGQKVAEMNVTDLKALITETVFTAMRAFQGKEQRLALDPPGNNNRGQAESTVADGREQLFGRSDPMQQRTQEQSQEREKGMAR